MTGGSWNSATRLSAAVLATGTLALIVTVAPSWERLTARAPSLAQLPPPAEPRSPSPLPFQDFSEVIERPLFNADRKPDPPPVASQETLQISLANYRLAGIITSGTVRVALLEQRATAKALKLTVGGTLDGRVVKEITASGIVFDGPAHEVLEFPKIRAAGPKSNNEASTPFGATGNGDAR